MTAVETSVPVWIRGVSGVWHLVRLWEPPKVRTVCLRAVSLDQIVDQATGSATELPSMACPACIEQSVRDEHARALLAEAKRLVGRPC
jgi:hypothetical protein